jgi:outer membrane protein OmpA-like peptidoglycan-associated protein
MKKTRCLVALLVTLAVPGAAFAQDQTSPDELVDFFLDSVDDLGKAKGLCIGTAQECAPKEKPRGRDMLVTFELNSAQLTPQALQSLDVFVQAMQDDRISDLSFVVEGHTDGLGSEAYNKDLSEDRAASVRSYLIAQGIEANRLTAIGLGETQPRVDNVYDPDNRRVEVRLGN